MKMDTWAWQMLTPKDTIAMDTVLTERLSAHRMFMTRLDYQRMWGFTPRTGKETELN